MKQLLNLINRYLGKVSLVEFLLCVTFVLIAALLINKRLLKNKYTKIEVGAFSIYLSCVLSITILGRDIGTIESSFDKIFMTYKVWLIDRKSWLKYEVLANVILFIPLGVFLRRKNSVIRCILLVLLFTGMIEFYQLITETGLFEMCDIIDNSLGGLVGCIIVSIWQRYKAYKKHRRI